MADFEFLVADLIDPDISGQNNLSTFAAYYQRLLYREVYPSRIFSGLDTWYDKQYYGKVDRVQNTIIPQQNTLSAINVGKVPNLLAANFVAEAFDDLAAHMRNAAIIGVCVSTGSPNLLEMKAHRAYEDPMDIYRQFLQTVFETFNAKTDRYSEEITDFPTFYKKFTEHLHLVAQYLPVTLTNYLLTDTIGPFNSGLTIAIDIAPFDVDKYKSDTYVQDPNYTFYVRSAKKFGLIVNKNAPWLLTADLFSDAAAKYFTKYGTEENPINEQNFFSNYFNFTYLQDIPILKRYIVNSYAAFVTRNPTYEHKVYRPKCAGKFSTEINYRPQLPPGVLTTNIITDKQLVDLYLDLRNTEAKNPVQITKKLRTELSSIYYAPPQPNLTPMENVARYINLIFRDYIYSTSYPALNQDLFLNLDNQIRTGKIATAGSIVQQLY